MVSGETNADEANTSSARIGNDAACAVSGSRTDRPIRANTQAKAKANSSSTSRPPTNAAGLVWIRKPTRKPTTHISTMTKASRTRSARVRPASTADRAMGSERNRSMRPLFRSSARPIAVFMAPKATVCTKMPGMR